MSLLPLFPELSMISRPLRVRVPTPKQYVLFYNQNYAQYNLKKKAQTPAWANIRAINDKYREAQRLTRETGELWVVDHIVPLNGGIVRGLHVEYNLRIVHWSVNASKGARNWPCMPEVQLELL